MAKVESKKSPRIGGFSGSLIAEVSSAQEARQRRTQTGGSLFVCVRQDKTGGERGLKRSQPYLLCIDGSLQGGEFSLVTSY
jgi:hypothetical protein